MDNLKRYFGKILKESILNESRYLVYPGESEHTSLTDAHKKAKEISKTHIGFNSRIGDNKTNTHVAFYRHGKLVSDKPEVPKLPKPLTDLQRANLVFRNKK